MRGASCSNLWQVGDADDLSVGLSHLLHDECHAFGNLARHTGVYLVEDDGGQLHGSGYQCLQREHDAGNFSTRCHVGNVLKRCILVGREEEGKAVCARCIRLATVGKLDAELYVGHTQRDEVLGQLLLDACGRLLA